MFSLATFFGIKKVNFWEVPLSQYAHVIIDVQKSFCSKGPGTRIWTFPATDHTEQVAGHIAKMAPAFRQAGIHTFIVYLDDNNQGISEAKGGLHKLTIEESDIIVPKNEQSAFQGSSIHKSLKEKRISHLLISGFNARACVHDTVIDAIEHKYQVSLLEDCIGEDWGQHDDIPQHIKRMTDRGAFVTNAAEALASLDTLAL